MPRPVPGVSLTTDIRTLTSPDGLPWPVVALEAVRIDEHCRKLDDSLKRFWRTHPERPMRACLFGTAWAPVWDWNWTGGLRRTGLAGLSRRPILGFLHPDGEQVEAWPHIEVRAPVWAEADQDYLHSLLGGPWHLHRLDMGAALAPHQHHRLYAREDRDLVAATMLLAG